MPDEQGDTAPPIDEIRKAYSKFAQPGVYDKPKEIDPDTLAKLMEIAAAISTNEIIADREALGLDIDDTPEQ